MRKVTIRISGVKGAQQLDEVEREVGPIYLKGTDDYLFSDMDLEHAQLAVAKLTSTPGIKAEIVRWS